MTIHSEKLLVWYDKNRRQMPWRTLPEEQPNPYYVWLSEIMLQQTTVVTVGPYFKKFIQRWPNVKALAKAKREDVLKMWAGLGYYRRAHALHEAAMIVCHEYCGRFPSTEEEILKLPGCGPYTAAAIAAIAFDKPANVVDGNVERVMARLFAVKSPLTKAKPELKSLAKKLVPKTRCGDYAQALMDLGATVCAPRMPKCGLCPLAQECKALAAGIAETLPRREGNKKKPVRRAIAFFIRNSRGEVFVRQRPQGGLLGGMTEIPTSEWREGPMPLLRAAEREAPVKARWKLLTGGIHHVFTHFSLELSVAVATSSGRCRGRWVAPQDLDGEALPSVMRKIIIYAMKHEGET